MYKAIQFYLLSMINAPVEISFEKELDPLIAAFINVQAVRVICSKVIISPEMIKKQVSPMPCATGGRNHRLSII